MFDNILKTSDLIKHPMMLIITRGAVADLNDQLRNKLETVLEDKTMLNGPLYFLRAMAYNPSAKDHYSELLVGASNNEAVIREAAIQMSSDLAVPLFSRVYQHPLTGEDYSGDKDMRFIEL